MAAKLEQRIRSARSLALRDVWFSDDDGLEVWSDDYSEVPQNSPPA